MTTEEQTTAGEQGNQAQDQQANDQQAQDQQVVLAPRPFSPMIPYAQFKRDVLKVNNIMWMQGKGRMFANVNGLSLIVATKTDINKPLFVRELTSNKNGEVIPSGTAYVLINSENVTVAATF